jgi:hypothetical protein
MSEALYSCRMRRVRAACFGLLCVFMSSVGCFSADIIFIGKGGEPSSGQRELELAAQFYGLGFQVVATSGNAAKDILGRVEQSETAAVAIEANVLGAINQAALLRGLRRQRGRNVPLLILGVTQETKSDLLREWASSISIGTMRAIDSEAMRYVFGDVPGVTEQLTGLQIQSPGLDTSYFASSAESVQNIIWLKMGQQRVPVFIEADLGRQKVFLLCKRRDALERHAGSIEAAFAEIAPMMIFTKYSAAARGWHALQHYANLTIDDPWLHEPYGHLAYKELLGEMEKHNFHTTIAFIPWNYDRSQAGVVELFRNDPDRFSICVHGDNHDHKEFDDFGSKSLALQTAAIKQSLARMEKFRTLTGIPYDHVFVFPHNIGSESILEALKSYNFIATINSLNVPIDRSTPASPLFPLRPVTLSFGEFPSVSRYSGTMTTPSSFIGISAFLDNPILFYGHQDLFTRGIDAFDDLADEVNKRQPATRWRSVGEVAKHLYLVRERDESDYDAFMFSSNINLDNTFDRSVEFHVQKQETDSTSIESVTVDGRGVPFHFESGMLQINVAVPPGESRNLVVRYKNDLDLATIGTSKRSLRVYVLRMASDFRDITLSEYSVGRIVTDYYYRVLASPFSLGTAAGCVLILFSVFGMYAVLLAKKKRKAAVLRSIMEREQQRGLGAPTHSL